MIPYGRQNISDSDLQAVMEVLRSDFLTQGPAVPAFENSVADYCHVRYAVAVSSATSALHLSCLALGVGKGDTVWTSPITFVASANCALYCGASVDFVDIDPRTYTMDLNALRHKLEEAERVGRLPKVVIPVHLCGQSCDMAGIHALSKRYGFRIIEDASHAIGGRYRGVPIGSCRFSDITVFSFHPVKIITTGEGGMALTNDAQLSRRLQLLRSHGITRDEAEMTHPSEGPWYYQQIDLGFNCRLTDLQASLGLSQMRRLDEFVAMRHTIARRYDAFFGRLPLTLPWQHPEIYSSFHLYVIRIKPREIRKSRREIFESLRALGIGVNVHYIPVYLQPYYAARLGFRPGYCPETERYYAEAISLPMYSGLRTEQQDAVMRGVAQVLAAESQ